jgi:diacylglycerol kinase (ATP)
MKKKFWTGRLKTILIVALIIAICAAVTLAITNGTSAIENVVDRISPELHPLSKKAKDMGSAAQFTAQICILVVWGTYLIGRFF